MSQAVPEPADQPPAGPPSAEALRLLVVEDDARLLDILTRHLDRMGYAVRGARGGGQALQLLAEAPTDVVLSDVRMPGMDGRTLLQVVRERYPEIKLVLMTAFGSVGDAVEAMKEGAYSYLTKPFKIEEVAAVLRNAAREIGAGTRGGQPAAGGARALVAGPAHRHLARRCRRCGAPSARPPR